MKLKLFFLTLFCSVIGWGQVMISQYIETNSGSTPKGIEIFNVSGADIVFSVANNLQIFQGTNGAACSAIAATNITSGTLRADEVWVIGTTDLTGFATSNGTNLSGTTTYNFSFNGNDALQLRLGGVIMDVFGTCGNDPGSAWTGGSPSVSTADNNIQTKSGVCTGTTSNWTDPSLRFETVANGSTMTGFGTAPTYCGSNPIITAAPTSLTGFTYVVGSGPSAEQTFTASGTNLTNDIVINAPTNYEISTTSGSGFTNTLTLPQTGGTVASTTIYVRLKAGLALGTYNSENIVCSSTGATSVNVTCSGSVTGSSLSDIITAGGEIATVSSLENDIAINTTADGVQVWQFTIRDGGGAADPDNLATIVNSLVVTQASGNAINDWADAIQAVALFNGATKIADGVVTTNTITFSGAPLIAIPDNGNITLSVRLSVQISPNDSGSNLDGDDFVFSINKTNVTADIAGSQFTNFSIASSTNGENVLDIVATQLIFIQQPTTTGVGAPMANVIVAAVDANGNIDTNFSGNISITSTGTMIGDPINVLATSGQSTFVGIIHTATGTNFTLTATSGGLTTIVSNLFDISNVTTLQQGDLAILAVNTNKVYGTDEIAFVCFQDILPGTTFYITDNGYEREFAGEWGGTEGVVTLTRTTSTLPRGTIIVFNSTTSNVTNASHFDIYTCGSIDTNWTKSALSGASIGGFNLNSDDDMWIMQGGTWTNDTAHHSTYTGGNVLYGWTESGWDAAPGGASGDTRWSTVFPGLECYNTTAPTGPGFVKFNDPVDPDFSTVTNGRLDWIALINNTANWYTYADSSTYAAGGYDYIGNTSCPQMTIAPSGYVNGIWTGRVDNNWFNCGNWDTLVVPDETVDVIVTDNVFNNQATVDATAMFADYYGFIAKARNLTVTGEKVEIIGDPNNILEVHGNLLIDGTGVLDMDDAISGTPDGTIHVFGNWTNNVGENAFLEGEGTVHFDGSTPQIISNVTPVGTEIFYDVVMNNDFTTSVSNDLIANGDLIVNTGKTVTVKANDYIQVGFNLTVDGTFNVEDDGSLVQVDDSGVNTGNINYERTTTGNPLDYVFWSSPVDGVNTPTTGYIYTWNPIYPNPNGGWGYWIGATNTSMAPGVGYIMRDVFTRTFTGVPRNGIIQPSIARANYTGTDFIGNNSVTITNKDDNWNLVGNPYPSAISALDFLNANSNIEGAVRIWTHGTSPDPSIADPVYDDYVYNYTVNDYIVYNGTGTVSGPAGFNGFIAGGQSFMINMLDGAAATETVTFNNAMRSKSHNNQQFYRQSSTTKNVTLADEKHRIWLDLADANNNSVRTLVGYVSGATAEKDRLYDAVSNAQSNGMSIFSIINDERMLIQGRSVPFDVNDKVQLSVNIPSSGLYSIGLSAVDGLFSDGQDIYIEDKVLNIIFDIKQMPYTFYAEQGEFKNRFILRFTNETLGIEDTTSEDSVAIFSQENNISISSTSQTIESVMIYNVLGQLLCKENNINSNNKVISKLTRNNQALIVKVNFNNGKEITRKIIF